MGPISTGDGTRLRLGRNGRLIAIAITTAFVLAACGSDDGDGTASATTEGPREAELITTEGGQAVTEDELPDGYEKTPTATVLGQELVFDDIPGHYWKVLDNGFAIGLHFQSDEPFAWAKDVPTGELLYIVYAIPGRCTDANFEQGLDDPEASVLGKPPPGFDHWHGMVGGGADVGHWLAHIAVRDFTFAGMEDNPMEGMEVKAGEAGFMPVCEPR
jgi:hypothetical protein